MFTFFTQKRAEPCRLKYIPVFIDNPIPIKPSSLQKHTNITTLASFGVPLFFDAQHDSRPHVLTTVTLAAIEQAHSDSTARA